MIKRSKGNRNRTAESFKVIELCRKYEPKVCPHSSLTKIGVCWDYSKKGESRCKHCRQLVDKLKPNSDK